MEIPGECSPAFHDPEAEIERGRAAMEQVIADKRDVMDAMSAPRLGMVSFLWGVPGRGPKFRGGHGVSHIIAKRNAEGGNGECVARRLPAVIAKGAPVRMRGEAGNLRVDIILDEHHVVLSQGDKAPGFWLLTGYVRERK